MKKIITVIAPMYNEENLVSEYCNKTLDIVDELSTKYDFEILLVNDGSTDNTYNIMLEIQKKHPKRISVICLSRNFGLEGAVNAGLRKASGDAVIVMDADLQDPPKLIPKMIDKWENGADVVVGSRIKRSNDKFTKKLGANIYYKILNALSGKLKLEKSAANFRLLSRQALSQILQLPEVNGVFRVMVPFIGMKTEVLEYDRDKRYAGKTKYNLKSMIPYALDSITGISVEPLRKIKWFFLITMILCCLTLISIMFAGPQWKIIFLILAIIEGMFALVFFVLSLMAEYVAQIMLEVKGRPTSIIYDYRPCENVIKKRIKNDSSEAERTIE